MKWKKRHQNQKHVLRQTNLEQSLKWNFGVHRGRLCLRLGKCSLVLFSLLGPYETCTSLAIGLGSCDWFWPVRDQKYCTTWNSQHNLWCFLFPFHGVLEFAKSAAWQHGRSLDSCHQSKQGFSGKLWKHLTFKELSQISIN